MAAGDGEGKTKLSQAAHGACPRAARADGRFAVAGRGRAVRRAPCRRGRVPARRRPRARRRASRRSCSRPRPAAASCASRWSTTTCRSWSIRSPRRSPPKGLPIDHAGPPDRSGQPRFRRQTVRASRKRRRSAELMIYVETARVDAKDRRESRDRRSRRRWPTSARRSPTGRR